MKFTNGYWLTKPEYRMLYATQCVRAEQRPVLTVHLRERLPRKAPFADARVPVGMCTHHPGFAARIRRQRISEFRQSRSAPDILFDRRFQQQQFRHVSVLSQRA